MYKVLLTPNIQKDEIGLKKPVTKAPSISMNMKSTNVDVGVPGYIGKCAYNLYAIWGQQ